MMEEKYYLQDYRSYVGNDMLWWADGGGYTCDITKAEVFSKEDAMALNKARYTDVPWPKEYIDNRTKLVVDMQCVKREEWLKGTGIELQKPPKKKRRIYSCGICGRFVSEEDYYHRSVHGDPCIKCEDDQIY
jgi:hypothetical protein